MATNPNFQASQVNSPRRSRVVKRSKSPFLNVIRLGSEHSSWQDVYEI